MKLQVYNTLTNKKEVFEPLSPGKVSMYVCGMTVYDFCHLGHARVMVAFDVISNYLRIQGYDVKYVRNITDIDDKIIKRALENKESCEELTERFITAMHEDERRLQNSSPDLEPKATAHIDDIISMVSELIDRDFAYAVEGGDVYFRVNQCDDYGKLSNKKLEDLIVGVRVDIDTLKEDPRDFVLWKQAKKNEPAWPSPWGLGRPGWHIECSAMSTCMLGNSFDIHGGGPDLVFPHHENEIAQSEAATGHAYAKYWLHAGAVRVDNEKMSKSLGNFFTIREILDTYHPEVVRYFLISSHYRSAINYSDQGLNDAKKALTRMYTALNNYEDHAAHVDIDIEAFKNLESYQKFTEFMNDDFNTPGALAVLFDLVSKINSGNQEESIQHFSLLKYLASTLGLLEHDSDTFLKYTQHATSLDENAIEQLIEQRTQAKLDKDYQRADEIRDQLLSEGVILEDNAEGVFWKRQ